LGHDTFCNTWSGFGVNCGHIQSGHYFDIVDHGLNACPPDFAIRSAFFSLRRNDRARQIAPLIIGAAFAQQE
jgi:hypothetical protein